jgi:hypothetical protein
MNDEIPDFPPDPQAEALDIAKDLLDRIAEILLEAGRRDDVISGVLPQDVIYTSPLGLRIASIDKGAGQEIVKLPVFELLGVTRGFWVYVHGPYLAFYKVMEGRRSAETESWYLSVQRWDVNNDTPDLPRTRPGTPYHARSNGREFIRSVECSADKLNACEWLEERRRDHIKEVESEIKVWEAEREEGKRS